MTYCATTFFCAINTLITTELFGSQLVVKQVGINGEKPQNANEPP